MTEVSHFNNNPPQNREEQFRILATEPIDIVVLADQYHCNVSSSGETDSSIDNIKKESDILRNIGTERVGNSSIKEVHEHKKIKTRSNGNLNLNQTKNSNGNNYQIMTNNNIINNTTVSITRDSKNNDNVKKEVEYKENEDEEKELQLHDYKETKGTSDIDINIRGSNVSEEHTDGITRKCCCNCSQIIQDELKNNIENEFKSTIILPERIKIELEDDKDPLERDKRPIQRNIEDDHERKVKSRMINREMMLEARRDIKTEKFIKNLPEIEGISYDRTFKCFRSRVPPRFSRFPMEALFSRKRYGLKNAWLKAIFHLYNNIAFLVFDYPRPGNLRPSPVIAKNEESEYIDKELIKKYLSSGYSIKYEEYQSKQNDIKEKYQKTSEEETSEGESSDYKIQDTEECLGLLSSTRSAKKKLPPEEEINPKMIADSLKPWHESIFWIPSICRWRTMYYDENSVKHSKTFTPSVFGGVKEAYNAAIEFRKMIDNMDKLNQSAIRRRWVKSNYSMNLQNNEYMEETRKFIDIDGLNKFNISIESRLPNNKDKNIENISKDKYNKEKEKSNIEERKEKIIENNKKNTERKENINENKKKENNIIIQKENIEKGNYSDNKQYDADFLSGLDKEGLYIPIPLDWKSN